ncbi:hypothetical protein SBA4_5960002 [Candidatus Sulfopaludibacter sp. SbA4]|nr:hypothetical protein SBA4_5960002 [Candidatus Sulfopaludibacter sp. SbA4]
MLINEHGVRWATSFRPEEAARAVEKCDRALETAAPSFPLKIKNHEGLRRRLTRI